MGGGTGVKEKDELKEEGENCKKRKKKGQNKKNKRRRKKNRGRSNCRIMTGGVAGKGRSRWRRRSRRIRRQEK